jgi:two-component sensor histidine kinase
MSVGLPDSAPWLLLEEMMHRVANEYVTAASMLLLSAAKASSSDARDAINAASDLLQQYAKVHKTLQLPRRGARLDLSNYLSDLCLALAKSRLEDRDIHLTFVVDAIELEPERCWHVGLIVAELITNSAKHAFGTGGGAIRVEVRRCSHYVQCKVIDSGSGTDRPRPGRGTEIVLALAARLGGSVTWSFGAGGTTATLTFESQASSAIEDCQRAWPRA